MFSELSLQELKPGIPMQCLTLGFRDNLEDISYLVNSDLDVCVHNIETFRCLQRVVRDPQVG
jgi:lipoyl synthase